MKTKRNKNSAYLYRVFGVFFPTDFLSPIYFHVLKLCILFLSSMKQGSDHEACIQWYEERSNLRIFAYFIYGDMLDYVFKRFVSIVLTPQPFL